jgi:hypothetical protein
MEADHINHGDLLGLRLDHSSGSRRKGPEATTMTTNDKAVAITHDAIARLRKLSEAREAHVQKDFARMSITGDGDSIEVHRSWATVSGVQLADLQALLAVVDATQPREESEPSGGELKACPFCGGDATFEHLENTRWSIGCADIDGECMGFQSLQTFPRKADAIAAWNRRTSPIDTSIARITKESIDSSLNVIGEEFERRFGQPQDTPPPPPDALLEKAVASHVRDFRWRANQCRTNMDAYSAEAAAIWDLAADALEGK